MPITIEIDDSSGLVRFEASGSISGEELLGRLKAFFDIDLSRFKRCRGWLSDYRETNVGTIGTPEMQELARLAIAVSKENPDLAVAVVVSADLHFGLARMWEALAEPTGWQIRVHRSLHDAKTWLDRVAALPG